MSGFSGQGYYGNDPNSGHYVWNQSPPAQATGQTNFESYNYDMEQSGFEQGMEFQSFDYNHDSGTTTQHPPDQGYSQSSGVYEGTYMTGQPSVYTGSVLMPDPAAAYENVNTDFEDEPPLMEELGINPDHILQKTLTVLNPFRETDGSIMQDTDLAGPLVFCLAFGGLLLLSGKVHFGYIYGIGVMGCLAMYLLLNLMSMSGVSIGVVISVLGYCLLPMVGLSGISILFSLQGVLGVCLVGITILWCSISASKLFVTALVMDHQQPLVAYPCALLYGVFALITVF